MRIAFCWYFDKAEWVYPNWRDGHRAAIEELSKKHQVDWYVGKKIPTEHYDFLLFWDDSNSEMFNHLAVADRSGICLTTDPQNWDNLRKVDVVFVESQPIYDAVRSQGIRTIKAFGTDTDFFCPDDTVKKDIEYFYPATFSPWKRQSDIAGLGDKLWCVGTVQPDGQFELEACKRNGVHVEEGYFPVEKIRDYYRRAKNVIIPAIHGSERTVLEAMACGVWPQVLNENNIRAKSYGEEYLDWKEVNPVPEGVHDARNSDIATKRMRDFVVKEYSHIKFAKQLLKGIES